MSDTKNFNPGMDEAQRKKDSGGFTTTTQMITGGVGKNLGENSGVEVGDNSSDPFGEKPLGRGETYKGGSTKADPKSGT